jgi:hypothetical protein
MELYLIVVLMFEAVSLETVHPGSHRPLRRDRSALGKAFPWGRCGRAHLHPQTTYRVVAGCLGDLLPPSPPAEKATANGCLFDARL